MKSRFGKYLFQMKYLYIGNEESPMNSGSSTPRVPVSICHILILVFKDLTLWYMQVYSGLQSQVGLVNQVADGFSWMLLRCIHDDQKVHSTQRLALKAVCNTKLAVALTIMEECFLSMSDPRTGIQMLPQVLYNWG